MPLDRRTDWEDGVRDLVSRMSDVWERVKRWVAGHPRLTRWLLAGPGVLAAALLFTMSMPVWFPSGSAGVNHIAYAQVFAPLNWGVLFTYACLEDDQPRGVAVIGGLGLICGFLSLLAIAGWI